MKTMKSKYFIYHIPGVKIGVSNNPDARTKIQGFSEYEILEEHTNAKEVSKRERILQAQYGYSVDKIEYWKTLRWQKKATTKKARKKAIANTDYKAKVANTDYKARTAKIDFSEYKMAQCHTPEVVAKRIANTDYKMIAIKHKKPINQYDLKGNFIKKWDSAKDAAHALIKNNCDITSCCRGKLKTAHKYIWKYAG